MVQVTEPPAEIEFNVSEEQILKGKKHKAEEEIGPDDNNGLGVKRQKIDNSTPQGPPQFKTPVSALSELYPGLKYELSNREGPPQAPIFTFSCMINGRRYEGTGTSKKTAKHEAASNALK